MTMPARTKSPPPFAEPPPRRETAPVEAVPVDPEDVDAAVVVLQNLINLMNLEADVTAREPVTAGDGLGMIQSVLDVDGEDLGLLIGRRGQTLASLQYLLNLILAKQLGKRVAFGVDVDGYRRRREEALISLAKRVSLSCTKHRPVCDPGADAAKRAPHCPHHPGRRPGSDHRQHRRRRRAQGRDHPGPVERDI